MKYSLKSELKYRVRKLRRKVNVKTLVTITLVTVVAIGGFKYITRDKGEVDAFEVNNAGVKVISKDARKLIANESTTAEDISYIINHWDEVRACDKARYGRRIQAMDSNVDFSIIKEEKYIRTRYREEADYVANLNKEMHRIINATQSIIELYNGFSVVDDGFLAEDIKEEIRYFNDEIAKGYDNIKALGKRERFETFYIQFDRYYRENAFLHEAVEKAMAPDAMKSDKELAYGELTRNYDKWNYVVNLCR